MATMRFQQSMATIGVGLALVMAGAPAATATSEQPGVTVAYAKPVDSGSSSGSGYLLEAILNALCALTGSKPTCWGDAL